ncbi:kinase-like domain-containing protein [Lyophyllum atratum]|nr:kinase-like domain-containing protein [Lyophyllum atratum]
MKVLDFTVKLKFTPKNDVTPSPSPRKRTNTTLSTSETEGPSLKRRTYLTVIEAEETQYMATRGTCTVTLDGAVKWTHEARPRLISLIKDQPMASGKTKHMYKLMMDGEDYAAKSFFDIGVPNHFPSLEENKRHLKQELWRQQLASQCVGEFMVAVMAKRISAADIRVASGFILTVDSGPDVGQTWLVDPMLSNTHVQKYSGTMHAGRNTTLLGKTCDAFAHFALENSGGQLVFADIQGILEPKFIQHVRGVDDLVLFDLMVHTDVVQFSANKSGGLGDRGLTGLRNFAAQHKCNSICKALGLIKAEVLVAQGEKQLPQDGSPITKNDLSVIPAIPVVIRIGEVLPVDPAETDASQYLEVTSPQIPNGAVCTAHVPELEDQTMSLTGETFTWGPFTIHIAVINSPRGEKRILIADLHGVDTSRAQQMDGHCHREVSRYALAQHVLADFDKALTDLSVSKDLYCAFTIAKLSLALRRPSNGPPTSDPTASRDIWCFMDDLCTPSMPDPVLTKTPLMDAALNALSHYAYSKYDGEFLLSDFEYCFHPDSAQNIVVHFKMHTERDDLSSTNGGSEALKDFRKAHVCNNVCLGLKLSPV